MFKPLQNRICRPVNNVELSETPSLSLIRPLVDNWPAWQNIRKRQLFHVATESGFHVSPLLFSSQSFRVPEQPAVPCTTGSPCCHSNRKRRGAWLPACGGSGDSWWVINEILSWVRLAVFILCIYPAKDSYIYNSKQLGLIIFVQCYICVCQTFREIML